MMFEEIKELSPKYFVLKADDIKRFLTEEEMYSLFAISSKISDSRKEEGKKDNEYVVLNLDDAFATNYMNVSWTEFMWHRIKGHFDEETGEWADGSKEPVIVRNIVMMLVNSISRAKYQREMREKEQVKKVQHCSESIRVRLEDMERHGKKYR